jgi:probable rRNA maturation factor
MAAIHFFVQELDFKLSKPRKTKTWIKEVLRRENKELATLNYIFCSDAYLLSINEQYLNHRTLTDIITFDNSDGDNMEGDIFISVERVQENASKLKTHFDEELHRVIIHGVLHLSGYGDKTRKEKALMRDKEDAYLSLRKRLKS